MSHSNRVGVERQVTLPKIRGTELERFEGHVQIIESGGGTVGWARTSDPQIHNLVL